MIAAGTKLGPYEILSALGAGGMGEVYRARDTRLDREVAIKVLPEAFSRDPERVARFQREAKVLASLNHPDIAGIYGFEEVESTRFLVMELVEGATLADRLRDGALPVEDALTIGRQIAEALEAAHERGIIHRDLKPANVKITPDGAVKVLDFGLAKAMAEDDRSQSMIANSPTITADFTRPGVILGTAAYMSPEQARGRTVDKRSDIWSFGCVLYECLTGKRPFIGETTTDLVAKILEREPDWSTLPPETPPIVQLLLRRCLAKDRNRRLRDIGDARIEIENAIADPTASSLSLGQAALLAAAERRPRRLLMGGLVGLAVILAAAAGVGIGRLGRPQAAVRKFELTLGELNLGRGVAVSPDGRRIAYVEQNKLWIRDLDRLEPRPLPGTEGAQNPFWSPDSNHVGYMHRSQLSRTSVHGGVSVICNMPGSGTPAGGAGWGEDGRIIFTTGNTPLYEVAAKGGEARVALELDEVTEQDFHNASLLPDGRGVLFVIHSKGKSPATIGLASSGSRQVLLFQDGERFYRPTYSSTGHILYERTRTTPGIWALPFSLPKLAPTGEPFLVAGNSSQVSVSTDGTLVFAPGSADVDLRLVWVDRAGKVLGTIGQPQANMGGLDLSPDGTRVAVVAQGNDSADIWIHDVARGTTMRFTSTSEGNEFGPLWSPDGTDLAYSTTGPTWTIKAADGVGPAREMGEGNAKSYTPDGKGVLLTRIGKETMNDIWYQPLDGSAEAVVFVQTPATESMGDLSPDGKFVAYVSDESGRREVYMKRFPSGEGKWLVSVDGGYGPRWDPNGRELFFLDGNALWTVNVQTDPSLTLSTPNKLFEGDSLGIRLGRGYDIAADGERLVAIQSEKPEEQTRGIIVVENWFAEFKDRP